MPAPSRPGGSQDEVYLTLNDIRHRRAPIASLQTNGFVERFTRTVKEEFFAVALKRKLSTTIDEFQKDFEEWLIHYNTERPHLGFGYRNMGACPVQTVECFSQAALEEG